MSLRHYFSLAEHGEIGCTLGIPFLKYRFLPYFLPEYTSKSDMPKIEKYFNIKELPCFTFSKAEEQIHKHKEFKIPERLKNTASHLVFTT